jgi:hypothetical protein
MLELQQTLSGLKPPTLYDFSQCLWMCFHLKHIQVMTEGHLGLSAWMPPPTLGLTARDVDSLHQALILVPRSDSIFGPPLA